MSAIVPCLRGVSSSLPEPLRLRLPIPFPIGHVNAYLLRGEPLTLVDPGPRWPETLATLEEALAAERLRIEDIELLVVTHQHEDHAGLAETVRRRAQCPVATHELVAGLLRDEPASREAEGAYAMALMRLHGAPEAVVRNMPAISADARQFSDSLVVEHPLRDGDVLLAGGRALEVRLRPGHSPTDTLFVAGDGVALVADHLLLDNPAVTVAHRPPDGPDDPRLRPRALLAYRQSLSATARDELVVAYPGHGERIERPADVIELRLATQERRAERILRELRGGARTGWDVVTSIWKGSPLRDEDHPMPIEFIVLSDVLAHIDLLVERGRVREIDDGVQISFEVALDTVAP
jgi:glyoxylase-like metal-dependent hydrolase (beta-lactamase superfamily II)